VKLIVVKKHKGIFSNPTLHQYTLLTLTPFSLCWSAALVDVWAACASACNWWDGVVVPSGGTGSLGARGVSSLSALEALSTGVTGLLFS